MKKLALTLLCLYALPASASQGETIRSEVRALRLSIALKLAEARAQDLTCDADAYPNEIISELGRAFWAGEEFREGVKQHPVFGQVLGTNVAYRLHEAGLAYYSALETSQLETILTGATIYGPHRGAYGSTVHLDFKGNGQLVVNRLDIDTLEWSQSPGTYRLLPVEGEQNRMEVNLGQELGTKVFQLAPMSSFSEILFRVDGEEDYEAYSSQASECEA